MQYVQAALLLAILVAVIVQGRGVRRNTARVHDDVCTQLGMILLELRSARNERNATRHPGQR